MNDLSGSKPLRFPVCFFVLKVRYLCFSIASGAMFVAFLAMIGTTSGQHELAAFAITAQAFFVGLPLEGVILLAKHLALDVSVLLSLVAATTIVVVALAWKTLECLQLSLVTVVVYIFATGVPLLIFIVSIKHLALKGPVLSIFHDRIEIVDAMAPRRPVVVYREEMLDVKTDYVGPDTSLASIYLTVNNECMCRISGKSGSTIIRNGKVVFQFLHRDATPAEATSLLRQWMEGAK